MKMWNLVIDVALCENCNNCNLASRDELVGNDHPGYSAPHASQGPSVVQIKRKVRGTTPMVDVAYVPVMCNHCDEAPCIKAAGDGSIRKRDDGIVIIDPIRARGRKDVVAACPYGAIIWNEEEQLPQSWYFDAHLLDAGETGPRLVSVCPTQAFEVVKAEDDAMTVRARTEGLRALLPELGTKPRVWYRNLWRYDHCFIGGSVSWVEAGLKECAEAVNVKLELIDAGIVQEVATDAFGDFKFDRLAADAGAYRVTIGARGVQSVATGSLGVESVYLGEIALPTAS